MRAFLLSVGLVVAAGPAFAETRHQLVFIRPGAFQNAPIVLRVPTVQTACDGVAIQPAYAEEMRIQAEYAHRTTLDADLSFSIDAEGRTRDIRPTPPNAVPQPAPVANSPANPDVQASLAIWRFAPVPRADCRLTIHYTDKPVAEATQGELLRYFAVTRTRGEARNAVAARLGGKDANCQGGVYSARRPRIVSHPDYTIGRPLPPGGRSWTVARWNVDAEGRAAQVETIGSSGDDAFDAETRRAITETLVHSGAPLQGCVYNFHRRGPVLPAPERPEREEDPLQDCPSEISDRFNVQPPADSFPLAFRERGVEGWALVRFDLATWGQVGNVEVVDAQPAAAFGDSAMRSLRTRRAAPGPTGAVRCVMPFNYKMAQNLAGATLANDVDARD